MVFDGTRPPAMEVNHGPGPPEPVIDPLLRALLPATVRIDDPIVGYTTTDDGGW
jgi:hypothetical protein